MFTVTSWFFDNEKEEFGRSVVNSPGTGGWRSAEEMKANRRAYYKARPEIPFDLLPNGFRVIEGISSLKHTYVVNEITIQ